jgi:hypothetical protein
MTRSLFSVPKLKNNQHSPEMCSYGRIRVPSGGHFFTCITLFNGRVPPEVIMTSILLEIGNKYTDEREKQFYLQG